MNCLFWNVGNQEVNELLVNVVEESLMLQVQTTITVNTNVVFPAPVQFCEPRITIYPSACIAFICICPPRVSTLTGIAALMSGSENEFFLYLKRGLVIR